MRKQYLILAAACLTIGITACGNSSTQSTTAQTSAETEASQDASEGTERTDETETEGSWQQKKRKKPLKTNRPRRWNRRHSTFHQRTE